MPHRITAALIVQWVNANAREAQGMLPVLVRKLISATSKTTALRMPGADSVSQPGWDGLVSATEGGAWVPVGDSCWELGCDARVADKARKDFEKRLAATPRETATRSAYLFVTPRKWALKTKKAWLTNSISRGYWREVRVYDADDLEAWIEAAPGVALWFGELIGIAGAGCESVERSWQRWSTQTRLALTAKALFRGRELERLALQSALASKSPIIHIRADSCEEAVAFACAHLLQGDESQVAATITQADGWRFVDIHTALQFGIAATPEIASTYVPRTGFSLIVPLSAGLQPTQTRNGDDTKRITLLRPTSEIFEQVLLDLGEEASDAGRLTRSTGRSWSVYRRVCARNAAIASPSWLTHPTSSCLTAITLIGCWDGEREGDKACLEAIAGQNYDALETQLRQIALLDDAPILHIGKAWKAKAPVELLRLFAPRITNAELSRFFKVTEAVLIAPDPALELPKEDRWMANIHGKVREQSHWMLDALADSLVKLSVYADDEGSSHRDALHYGVDGLVRKLLENADGERWLSLAGVLRELAEASPDVFLKTIETSLQRSDQPVSRLITETSASSFTGRCWHADLLWALEVLAWRPSSLGRVASVLAQLTSIPVKGNWSNTPLHTLSSVFRPWWTQTTASTNERLAVLDRLLTRHNDAAWNLLNAIAPRLPHMATGNAKPVWREDAAGAPGPQATNETQPYWLALCDRLIAQASSNANRIAQLVGDIDHFDSAHADQLADMMETATAFDDAGREAIRTALRKHLSWHNSYNNDGSRRDRQLADRLRPCFDSLAPRDLVLRHRWLFEEGWMDLPDGRDSELEKRDEECHRLRNQSLQEIFVAEGWAGLSRFVLEPINKWLLGFELMRSDLPQGEALEWVWSQFKSKSADHGEPLMSGALRSLSLEGRQACLQRLLPQAADAVEASALLCCAPCERNSWSLLETQLDAVQLRYWEVVRPGYLSPDSPDQNYLVDHLIQVGRHRTAFHAISAAIKKVDPIRLMQLLEGIRGGQEPAAELPRGWNLGEAINAIAESQAVTSRELAVLEFAFYPLLERDAHGTKHLFAEILRDPALFMELICLVYRPRNAPAVEINPDQRGAAEQAWSVLHSGRGVPGLQGDGSIQPGAFQNWIECVRRLAVEHDRMAVTDITIGQWLSACPSDPGGLWPCQPVRDLLDEPDAENLRKGFSTGVFNNRGVTTRGPFDGGAQERDLASTFQLQAQRLHASHPQVSAMLEELSRGYEGDGGRMDIDAQLRTEGIR